MVGDLGERSVIGRDPRLACSFGSRVAARVGGGTRLGVHGSITGLA